MTDSHSDTPVVIGAIGHVPPKFLKQVKKDIQKISHFKIIFFKESSGKLWIVSGEDFNE
ncbi:MAG: hypothetical protein ACFFCM_21485 [Promethearchaeota archaeon]